MGRGGATKRAEVVIRRSFEILFSQHRGQERGHILTPSGYLNNRTGPDRTESMTGLVAASKGL